MHWKQPLKKVPSYVSAASSTSPIRRSVSCPRSISALAMQMQADKRPFTTKPSMHLSRSSLANRSHSLNRGSSTIKVSHTANPGSGEMQQGTREQEELLTKETLAIFSDMKIRYPGKTNEEADLIIDDITDNWKYHKSKVASYWLIKLDSVKQRKVLDIVKVSIRSVLKHIWRVSDVECLHLYRLFNRVFNRLLWSHGQGLWNCFCSSGSSWETIFSKSTEAVTADQLQCCQRIVELCKQCLLVVYKYSSDVRGTISGMNSDWDDTRYA
uniref:Tubulin polyglutamylase TTLL7-like n=1 Tax=Naja naja TaxID=35670 RepID=A0A8C6VAC6_NAJNA